MREKEDRRSGALLAGSLSLFYTPSFLISASKRDGDRESHIYVPGVDSRDCRGFASRSVMNSLVMFRVAMVGTGSAQLLPSPRIINASTAGGSLQPAACCASQLKSCTPPVVRQIRADRLVFLRPLQPGRIFFRKLRGNRGVPICHPEDATAGGGSSVRWGLGPLLHFPPRRTQQGFVLSTIKN